MGQEQILPNERKSMAFGGLGRCGRYRLGGGRQRGGGCRGFLSWRGPGAGRGGGFGLGGLKGILPIANFVPDPLALVAHQGKHAPAADRDDEVNERTHTHYIGWVGGGG